MPGLVNHGNRQVSGDGIEIVACGMTPLLELGIVIAKTEHDAQLFDLRRGLDVLAQRLLQIGDRGVATVGRRQQIGRNGLQPHAANMAVRVHKARNQRAALQVQHTRARAAQGLQLLQRADGGNHSGIHRHGFHLGLGIVHGENRAAVEDHLGGPDRGLRTARSTAREPGR